MAASVLSEGPVRFSSSLYPEEAVIAACAAYNQFLELTIEVENRDRIVGIAARAGESTAALTVRREFLNYVLDLALQYHLKRP